jgi:hypothetical protein
MTTTDTIKARLRAIVAAEGVTEGPWFYNPYRAMIGQQDPSQPPSQHRQPTVLLHHAVNSKEEDCRFIASSRTLLPGMAEVHLEEIEWLEESAWENSVCEDRLAALVERLEGILGS